MCISGMGTFTVAKIALLAVGFHLATAYISLDEGPPGKIFVNVSDTVTLVCDLRDVGNSRIQWYHYEAGHILSYNRDIVADLPEGLAERLEIVGDPAQEQFNLRIRDFRLSDLGGYSCYYMYPAALIKKIATTALTLYVPAPECIVEPAPGGDAHVAVGDQVNLRCIIAVTGGAFSPTLIEYRRGDSEISLASSTTDQLAFQRQLLPEDNGVDFTCTLTSPQQDGPRSCSVRPLEILPTARVTPPMLTIDKGTGVSLVCEASGIPSIASYRWEIRATATGEELPLGQDMVTQGVHVLSISTVREAIIATCIVTTPNGLSNNSSAKISVIKTEAPTLTTAAEKNSPTAAEKDSPTTVANFETTVTLHTTQPSASDTAPVNGAPVPAITTLSGTNTRRRAVTNQPIDGPFPTIVIVSAALATAAVAAVIVVLICYCCVWRRKKSPTVAARYTMVELGTNYEDVLPNATDDATVDERGNTYQEVPATYPAEQRGNTYQEVRSSSTDATVSVVERDNTYQQIPASTGPGAICATTGTVDPAQSGANAATGTPLYAVPKKPKRGTPRNLTPDDQIVVRSSVESQYATPKKPRRPSAGSRKPAPMPRRVPTDTTLYAQPRKLSKRIKNKIRWGVDKNGYRIAEGEDARRVRERRIVYADVDVSPAGIVTVGDTPKPKVAGEQTLYAQIT